MNGALERRRMAPNRNIQYAVSCLTDCSVALLVFAVSRSMAESDANLLTMGFIGGGYALSSALGSLWSGRISDRRASRHGPMFVSIVILTVGVFGCCVIRRTDPLYYLIYMLCGAAGGMLYPPLIADLTLGRNSVSSHREIPRVLVIFCLAWNLGVFGGQLGAGWLFRIDPVGPILAALVLTTLSAGLVFRLTNLRDPAPVTKVEARGGQSGHQTQSADFARLAWLANLGATFALSMILHLLPKLIVAMDIPAHHQGMLTGTTRGLTIATFLLMYRLQFWHHRFSTVAGTHVLAVVGLLVISMAQTELDVLLGLAGVAQFMGYSYFAGLYYSITGTEDDRRATAAGINEATLAAGLVGGSVLGGLIGHVAGDRAPYQLAALVILGLLLIQTLVYWRRIRPRWLADR